MQTKISQGGTGLKKSWWRHPPGIKTHCFRKHLFSCASLDGGLWMTRSRRESLSHRRVIGLQTVGGTVKRCSDQAYLVLGKQKHITWERGKKKRLALSILHSLTLLLTKPAVVYTKNTSPYLFQGETFRLHPQFVSSRWGSVTKRDRCRRPFPPEHCTWMLVYICMLSSKTSLWLF